MILELLFPDYLTIISTRVVSVKSAIETRIEPLGNAHCPTHLPDLLGKFLF